MDVDIWRLTKTVTANNNITIWGMPIWACWLLIGIFLIISALYSASENAYSNCNKYHFKVEAEKGSFTAKIICYLVEKFDNTLVTILIGNNIVQTLMSFLSALLFYNICQIYNLNNGVEAILSTVVMASLVYIISDTVPKILSKTIPNRMAYFLAYPVIITNIILFPIIFLFKGILVLIHKIFKINDQNILSKDDLLHSVNEAVVNEEDISVNEDENEKLFENDEKEIINNVFNFDKKNVEKIYTPLAKVYAIDESKLNVKDLTNILLETNYSRIPVYSNNKENIIGILVVRIYFEEYAKDQHLAINSILEQPIEIESYLPLDDALKKLNEKRVHLAIVKKDDITVGIVTMEDIIEELIQNIDENKIRKTNKEGQK